MGIMVSECGRSVREALRTYAAFCNPKRRKLGARFVALLCGVTFLCRE